MVSALGLVFPGAVELQELSLGAGPRTWAFSAAFPGTLAAGGWEEEQPGFKLASHGCQHCRRELQVLRHSTDLSETVTGLLRFPPPMPASRGVALPRRGHDGDVDSSSIPSDPAVPCGVSPGLPRHISCGSVKGLPWLAALLKSPFAPFSEITKTANTSMQKEILNISRSNNALLK